MVPLSWPPTAGRAQVHPERSERVQQAGMGTQRPALGRRHRVQVRDESGSPGHQALHECIRYHEQAVGVERDLALRQKCKQHPRTNAHAGALPSLL